MSKIAFIFSGQGAQYVGMGKDLYEKISECRKIFEIAEQELKIPLTKICFEGSKDEIDKTENTQPAILTLSIAAMKALEKQGIKPDVTAGLSLGEYSALVCSNVIDFKDAVSLVRKRGQYMENAVPNGVGTMAAIIGLKKEIVKEICDDLKKIGIVQIANINCPGQIVISGEINAVEKACEIAKEKRALKCVKLSVSGPFHSVMLKEAGENLYEELQKINLKSIDIPFITNVTGDFVKSTKEIKDLLKKQVMSTVLWEDSIKRMIDFGVDIFIEIGPSKVLSGFVKKINRKVTILNVEDMDSLNKTIDKLQTIKIIG
ncbi:ACP S-malonyltransferase [Clostridium sporogenes]|nr:ACP S-malonyltransferase [Clostridium sporogenes]NFS25758.1 ACP S-malonyltransferase [Clostridium sporogenes]